jgi:hypothetical protein
VSEEEEKKEKENKNAIVKRSNAIVKRTDNSQVSTIKQRFRERNKQNKKKDNNNLNNKISKTEKRKMPQDGKEGGSLDTDAIETAHALYGPKNKEDSNKSSNNNDSSQKKMRIVK